MVPDVLIGFHLENCRATRTPTRSETEDIAELVSAVVGCNEPRYILSKTGDLSVFDNDHLAEGPALTILGENGDIHCFEKFHAAQRGIYDEMESIFNIAKRLASSLRWPLRQHGGADYRLHRGEIEVYLMGGTKKLPKQQKAWREDFRNFGKKLYRSVLKGHYEIEVVEENIKPGFRVNRKSGAYLSGYLKSVVRARIPDLELRMLP